MTPQLTKQQLEHAIENLQKRVDAKKLECASYSAFKQHAPAALGELLPRDTATVAVRLSELQDATENLFTAWRDQSLIELEELELTLRAYKQMSSGIVGATLIPPSNSRIQH
jgi:hypothetical protein